jgi:hypothetical protein
MKNFIIFITNLFRLVLALIILLFWLLIWIDRFYRDIRSDIVILDSFHRVICLNILNFKLVHDEVGEYLLLLNIKTRPPFIILELFDLADFAFSSLQILVVHLVDLALTLFSLYRHQYLHYVPIIDWVLN